MSKKAIKMLSVTTFLLQIVLTVLMFYRGKMLPMVLILISAILTAIVIVLRSKDK
ncbi:hypothetical protein RyT2_13350 [Pseudolactococcus yaeyamensis]